MKTFIVWRCLKHQENILFTADREDSRRECLNRQYICVSSAYIIVDKPCHEHELLFLMVMKTVHREYQRSENRALWDTLAQKVNQRLFRIHHDSLWSACKIWMYPVKCIISITNYSWDRRAKKVRILWYQKLENITITYSFLFFVYSQKQVFKNSHLHNHYSADVIPISKIHVFIS